MNKCDHCKKEEGVLSFVSVYHGKDKWEATGLFHLCHKCALDVIKWVFNK